MKDLIQLITATDSEAEAYQIAKILLESKLAACVNIYGPVHSSYWWQGQIDQALEWQCVVKTRADLFREVQDLIRSVHSYDVPEIVAIPILEVNPEYQEWIDQVIKD